MAETTKETKDTKDTTCDKKCNFKQKKGLIIGCIAAAVVVIAAIVALVIINPFKNAMVGKYTLTGIIADGEEQEDSLSLLEALGIKAELEIIDNNNGKISIFGQEAKFTYDDKQFHLESSVLDSDDADDEEDGQVYSEEEKRNADYTYKDGKITVKSEDSEMIFTKKTD